jgi:hypothetical protein
MSDFTVSQAQRRRLLDGDMNPLLFDAAYPVGCKVGAMYVLAWKRKSAAAYEDGFVVSTPRHPVWFLTVTKMMRRRQGGWRVEFEVQDRRDPDLWLSHSGDYQFTRRGAVDDLPVAPSDEVRRKAIGERDHLARLQRHAAKLKAQARAKRARRAA